MAKIQAKQRKARPFEKLMLIMLHGQPVTKAEIQTLLGWSEQPVKAGGPKGPKITNISSYIWDIKNVPMDGIVVRSARDGKKVESYQIVNVDVAKAYLAKRGLYTPPVAVEVKETIEAPAAVETAE
jgi:hypothetical protein